MAIGHFVYRGFVIASAILPTLEEIGGFQAMFGASAVLVFVAGSISLLLNKEVRQAANPNPSAS